MKQVILAGAYNISSGEDIELRNLPKKILVTGGCGFIGSNFIKHMLKKYTDYEITNYDKLTYAGNKSNTLECEFYDNYHFIKGDINDY